MSINCGFGTNHGHKVPIGMQIIRPKLNDDVVVAVANAITQSNKPH